MIQTNVNVSIESLEEGFIVSLSRYTFDSTDHKNYPVLSVPNVNIRKFAADKARALDIIQEFLNSRVSD